MLKAKGYTKGPIVGDVSSLKNFLVKVRESQLFLLMHRFPPKTLKPPRQALPDTPPEEGNFVLALLGILPQAGFSGAFPSMESCPVHSPLQL